MMGFKKGISISLATVLILLPVSQTLAHSGEVSNAVAHAKADAQANTSTAVWMGAGCLFGLLGLGAAYLIVPNPPATSLLGKSSDYVAIYTDTYRETAKNIQTKNAMIGCVIGTLAQAVWIVILVSTEDSGY